MVRMILIYTALFAVAAGAIWMKPKSGADELASLSDDAFANMTQTVLTDLGAGGADVSRTVSASDRPVQRPLGSSVSNEVIAQIQQNEQAARSSGLISIVAQALEEDSSGAQLETIIADDSGAVDLAPLLEVPGSIAGENGTRILASALLLPRQQGAGASDQVSGVTNIQTLSVSPDPVETQEAETRYWTVKPGDSLGSIAQEVYGSPNAFRRIFDANRDVLASIDAIRVGQKLRIP